MMRFFDIFTLVLSLLGIYGVVFSLRLLLPRNVVPLVSASLKEAIAPLEDAEAVNIANVSDYRANLAMYALVCTHQRPVTDRTQLSQPILADAYREPSLSRFFSAALPAFSVWADLEAIHP
jgi:hypothetical protein